MNEFDLWSNKREDGSTLVFAIMILMILSLIGAAAISTATCEIRISANDLFSKVSFYSAESGFNLAMEDLTECLNGHAAYPATDRVKYLDAGGKPADGMDARFHDEAVDVTLNDPANDLRVRLGANAVEVDVQRDHAGGNEGGSAEFADASASYVFYDLNAVGEGPANARYALQAGCRILVAAP